MERILKKIKSNGLSFGEKLPQSRMNADGSFALGHGGNWTDGFYVGVLNLAYILSEDIEFRTLAKKYDDFFALRIQNTDEVNKANKFLKLDHDVGMIFLPSIGFNYSCDGQEKDKNILVKAADILVERFNPKGNFIRAWDTWPWDADEAFIEEKKGKAIIDSMMNIPLLFKAAQMTGNDRYYDIAIKHAHTMAEYIIRKDYSTFHTYNFNHLTGEPIKGKTAQGYSHDSCWSRGQAWAVYGFALAYKYTKCERFFIVSDKTAEYFMNHLSSMDMPCWDFDAINQTFAPWDSSASLICASGLLELYELTGEKIYMTYAKRLLRAVERFCLTTDYEACQPLILHGCSGTVYTKEKLEMIQNPVIDQALIYADYFYMECLLKLSEHTIRIF